MTRLLLSLILMLCCTLPVFAQPVETDWVRRYNGSLNSYDAAVAIAVDDEGDVYATGHSTASGTGVDYTTIKYYPDGDTAWLRRHNGSSNVQDYAYAIAVDDSKYVYVTGGTWNTGTGEDYGTIKYYPNGDTAWVRRYNGPANEWDEARAIAVDGDGNVYVTGCDRGIGTNFDYATIKYYPNGDTAWVRRYNGVGNFADVAQALVVDGAGNVYVTGYSAGSGTDFDCATIKYYPNGAAAWVSRYNGPGNGSDRSTAIAVDGSGNVYVTGYIEASSGRMDYVTIKYHPDGDTAWVRTYDGPSSINDDDWSEDIAVDSSGNVYVTGRINDYDKGFAGAEGRAEAQAVDAQLKECIKGSVQGVPDFCTIKYYPNGDTAWVRTYDGPGNSNDGASALGLDDSGNVYVTGQSAGSGTSYDYATIKYYPDGDEAWVMRYDGPAGDLDYAYAVAVDASGYVYVTGSSYGSGTYGDWATMKYVQGAIHDVSIIDFAFVPQIDTAEVGENIRWTNNGSLPHSATSDAKTSWDSGTLLSGESFVFRFNHPGSYPYHCKHNPFMTGIVVVETPSGVRDETGSRERPSQFDLSNNYPNPFNPTTRIEFTLGKSCKVNLDIYDLLGRRVRTLVSEHLSPGYKSVIWDGTNEYGEEVASGIYFYRIKTDEFSQAKKMLLLR